MRQLKWIVPLVIVLSLFLVPVVSAAPAAQYPTCGYWYPVQWGQTLASISWATGVSGWAIAQANGLANPNYIQAGQSLWIPCPAAPPPPPPPPPPQPYCGYWYPVHWGETLSSIAWRTGVNPWAIAQANGLYNPNYIRAGQSLWIPCPY
jgi:LysM repeat protein